MYLISGKSDNLVGWSSRYPRLLEEICRLNADVLCLQEVQSDHFQTLLKDLAHAGYYGVYKQRTNRKPDGCATFFKTGKVTSKNRR